MSLDYTFPAFRLRTVMLPTNAWTWLSTTLSMEVIEALMLTVFFMNQEMHIG